MKYVGVIFFLLLYSCGKNDDVSLHFIGDSIIERWDVEMCFPAFICFNHGKTGTGINHLMDFGNISLSDSYVIILTGTNDLTSMQKDDEKKYIEDLYACLTRISAKKICCISILPRNDIPEFKEINDKICRINKLLQDKIIQEDIIVFIDVYSIFASSKNVFEYYYFDDLHLNKYGYELLTIYVKKHIR